MRNWNGMPRRDPTDRRQTARIPTGARLLHRAVGMADYALCDVLNVTTSGIEILAEHPLAPGTVVTMLVRPDGESRRYYRVYGSVERREPRSSRWLHVIRASSRRPWSSMFIYDLMYQALTGSAALGGNGHAVSRHGHNGSADYAALIEEVERVAAVSGVAEAPNDDDSPVYQALAWLAPFDELGDSLRRVVSRDARIAAVAAGTCLIDHGSMNDVAIYVLDGILELQAPDGRKSNLVAGTHEARFPVSLLRPHAYTVTTVTDASVIRLSQDTVRQMIRVAAAYRDRPGLEVVEEHTLPTAPAGA